MEKTLSPWLVIEKLRSHKGISKKLLAEKLQINYNYLVDLLNGRYQTNIGDEKIRLISDVLDIPIGTLLDELHHILPGNGEPAHEKKEKIAAPAAPLIAPAALPIFRIISGSKIDHIFNRPELWVEKSSGMESLTQPLFSSGKNNDSAKIAVKLEDNSLFPPFSPGSIFIADRRAETRPGNLVLAVMKNYRAWIIEWRPTGPNTEDKITLNPYNNIYSEVSIPRSDLLCLFPVIWIRPA